MSRLTVAALSAVLLAYVGHASAELKKIRDWPPSVEVPSPDIKRQYEYDPEAGATTAKLLSITSRVIKDGAEVYTQTTNYRNSAPVSGSVNWNNLVIAYHGFAGFIASPMKTTKLKYSSNGAWPAREFKIYTENVSDQVLSKSATACRQVKTVKANEVFGTLPGSIYVYECLMKYGGVSEDFTYAPDSISLINIYSDYLGVLVSSFYKKPQENSVRTKAEYRFLDLNGKEQVIMAEENAMRSEFSQL